MTMTLERAGVTPGLKTCTNPDCPCENPQPLERFTRDKRSRGGRKARCVTCTLAANKRWRQANPEKFAAQKERNREGSRAAQKRWYEKNRERELEKGRAYNLANREKRRAYGRARYRANAASEKARHKRYVEANRERLKQYESERYATHRELQRLKNHEYHATNRERIKARKRAWRAVNVEKVNIYSRRRRARKVEAKGSHTVEDVLAKLELQGGLCYYCSCDLTEVGYEVEHKVPLSGGGSEWPANICCACSSCNKRKRAKPFWKFIKEVEGWSESRLELVSSETPL